MNLKGERMMLDNLLESKVRNKVLIFIILFNNNVLHLDKMSTYLNISDVYLKDLVTELNQLLQGKARIQFQKDKHLKLIMAKNVNYLEIIHQIYGESIILKYFEFLINDHEQLSFSAFIEKNYHSIANAYRIRNKAEKYLKQIGLKTYKHQIAGPEYRIRFFIAMLYSQYGVKYYSLSDDDIRIAHQFILASNHAIQPKLLETTADDFLFFEVLLMLTWVRRENNVELQDWEDLTALKQLFIYQQLVDYVHLNLEQSLNTFFNQTELDYIFLCYCTTNNFLFSDQWQNEDIKALHQIVFTNKQIKSLLQHLTHKLRLGKEVIFTRNFRVAIVYFYKKCILNLHPLLPESNPFLFNTLNTNQKVLFNQVQRMIDVWRTANNIPYFFTKEQIYFLTNQIEVIYQLFIPEIDITIVTNTISEYESIALKLTTTFNHYKLNPKVFMINAENIEQLYQNKNTIVLIHPKFATFIDETKLPASSPIIKLAIDYLPTYQEQLIQLFKQFNNRSFLALLN